MIQASIFFLYSWWRQTAIMKDSQLIGMFGGVTLICTMIYMMNIMLIEGLVELFQQKMIFKNLLLLMIDRDQVDLKVVEPIFPTISLQDPPSLI